MIYSLIGIGEGLILGFFFLLIEALNEEKNCEGRLLKRDDIKKSCESCLYNKKGKCMTLFSQDSKDNGLFLWYEACHSHETERERRKRKK